jgi:hypothetical protein
MNCPKCEGKMEEGYIPDATYGGLLTPSWVEGAPEKSTWRRLKTKGKRQLPVAAFRCTACGFLEFYARPA